MKQPKKNKSRDTFKNSGPGQRKKIMEDPLYGKGSGSGTIRKDEGFNFTNIMNAEAYSAVSNTQVYDASGFNGTGQGEGSIETDEVTMQARDNNGTDFDANPMAMTLHGDLA